MNIHLHIICISFTYHIEQFQFVFIRLVTSTNSVITKIQKVKILGNNRKSFTFIDGLFASKINLLEACCFWFLRPRQ
jgi:hypothetical protein